MEAAYTKQFRKPAAIVKNAEEIKFSPINNPQTSSLQNNYSQVNQTQINESLNQQSVNRSANIVKLPMSALENESSYATGSPIKCQFCSGILGCHSKENIKFDKEPHIWMCDYCHKSNLLQIELSEIPEKQIVTYILENKSNKPIVYEEQKLNSANFNDESTIIFCVDISGSMKTSQTLKEIKQMKYVKKLGSPTRLECVKVAIDSQIQHMLKSTPNRKVGLVTFGNDVTIYGDCTHPKKVLSGTLLDNYESMLETVEAIAQGYMTAPIKNSYMNWMQVLGAIGAAGSTALGPGLVASLALANVGKIGSKVIICTDGLANVGLGSVEVSTPDETEKTRSFYSHIGLKAKTKGISISIISIVESECRLDLLSPISDLTNGEITKVDPINMADDFENFLADTIIATQVLVEVRLHKCLRFNKEDPAYISNNGSLLKREIGNASRDIIVTFEYSFLPDSEMEKIENFNFSEMKKIPLQAVITYMTLDEIKCQKVISQVIEISDNYAESQSSLNSEIVQERAAYQVAQHARRKSFSKAQESAQEYQKDWGMSNKEKSTNMNKLMDAIDMQVKGGNNALGYDCLVSEMNKVNRAHKKK